MMKSLFTPELSGVMNNSYYAESKNIEIPGNEI